MSGTEELIEELIRKWQEVEAERDALQARVKELEAGLREVLRVADERLYGDAIVPPELVALDEVRGLCAALANREKGSE